MAGRSTDDIDLAPPDAPTRAEYERDFYSWSKEQARLVREGRWSAVDRENVAEEIESLGRAEFDRLDDAVRVLLTYMLQWDHQPNRRGRDLALSIELQRFEIEDVLADNRGLRSRQENATARAYRRARILAAKETGLDELAFPNACPYSWDNMTARRLGE